jgi:mRNA interferase RelE/StbE
LPYRIEWKASALREFSKLPPDIRSSVESAVAALGNNPRPDGCRNLAGTEDTYRL